MDNTEITFEGLLKWLGKQPNVEIDDKESCGVFIYLEDNSMPFILCGKNLGFGLDSHKNNGFFTFSKYSQIKNLFETLINRKG